MDFVEGEVLYFDKPYKWTSFDVVGRVRWQLCRSLGVKKLKVGHAGTLDPLATGVLAYPILCRQVEKINRKFPNVLVHVYEIKNNFYGEKITVAGLLTYGDIKTQLEGKPLGSKLLIPNVCLRTGENVFLDDYSVEDLEKALNIKITIVESMGNTLVEDIIK